MVAKKQVRRIEAFIFYRIDFVRLGCFQTTMQQYLVLDMIKGCARSIAELVQ